MMLEDALAAVTGEICLQIHEVLGTGTQKVEYLRGPVLPTDHATWLARGAKLFTLTKLPGKTLAFCHDNETMYYASPACMLSSCPDGTSLLVQVVEDRQPDDPPGPGAKLSFEKMPVITVLVMDLVSSPEPSASARHRALWGLKDSLHEPLRIQWGGSLEPLRTFLAGGLPHEVAGEVALRAPLEIAR